MTFPHDITLFGALSLYSVGSIQDREKSIIPNKNPLGGFLEHLMFHKKFKKNCNLPLIDIIQEIGSRSFRRTVLPSILALLTFSSAAVKKKELPVSFRILFFFVASTITYQNGVLKITRMQLFFVAVVFDV